LMQAGSEKKFNFGESYLTVTNPGKWRAGHYHEKTREWFIVLSGEAVFRFRNPDTGENSEMIVASGDMLRMEVAPRMAHAFKNIGRDPLFVLAVADRDHDPDHPDTFLDNEIGFNEE